MASPIFVTKLFIPSTRAEIVPRPDLIERLNDGLDRKLTLLSAPAGFGKTNLVSHWLEQLGEKSIRYFHDVHCFQAVCSNIWYLTSLERLLCRKNRV